MDYADCWAQAGREFPFVDNVGWPDGHEPRFRELLQEHRVPVDCDDECGALMVPGTFEEAKATLDHLENHSC